MGHDGGCGSVLAATAQNAGSDGQWGTDDDVLSPINSDPSETSLDANADDNCADNGDRVRNFIGGHGDMAVFAHADGSVLTISASVDGQSFRRMSTMRDEVPLGLSPP